MRMLAQSDLVQHLKVTDVQENACQDYIQQRQYYSEV